MRFQSRRSNKISYYTDFSPTTCLRFEYDLLAKFLIEKRGYDEAIKVQSFDKEVDFVCKVN